MTRDEYVSEVINQIRSKRKREIIRAELESHIDDRTEYYTDCGIDEETALKKSR